MTSSVLEKPKRAPQITVPTLERKSRPIAIYASIKGVETKQIDIFLTKAAELAKVQPPYYHTCFGCRNMGYDGTRGQLIALMEAMQKLESKELPKGTRRLQAGEAIPEGAGSFIRYNNV